MTETHAIAHRECGNSLIVSSEDTPWGTYERVLVCQSCDCLIEDIFDEVISSADDTELLAHRLLDGDDDVELVEEDPRVWARKTSDDQVSLFEFENEGDRT